MNHDLNARLAVCERNNRRLTRVVITISVAFLLICTALLGSCRTMARSNQVSTDVQGTLTVTELVVVDRSGVVRARIGGDLPDAVIDGKSVPRGEKAAGLLLYDDTGQERGGYVTWEPSGNVGLTLDSRRGQLTLFVAGPDGGSALSLWNGDDSIELRSDDDGSRLTAVAGGRVMLQMPEIDSLGAEACTGYRDALERFSRTDVIEACRKRYAEDACLACLGSEE